MPFQQPQFRITSLNTVSKKSMITIFNLNFLGAEMKITSENERLLKRIVEITFRTKKSAAAKTNGIDH